MVQKIKKRDVSEYPAWLYYICWVLVLPFGLFCLFDVGSGHSSLPDVPHDGHAVVDVLTAVVSCRRLSIV